MWALSLTLFSCIAVGNYLTSLGLNFLGRKMGIILGRLGQVQRLSEIMHTALGIVFGIQ